MLEHSSVKYDRLSNVEEEAEAEAEADAASASSGTAAVGAGLGALDDPSHSGVNAEVPIGGDTSGTFNYASVWSYQDDPATADATFNARHNYDSAFKYRDSHARIKMDSLSNNVDEDELATREPAYWLVVTSWMLTFFSYLFFVLTIPISYWMLVKKMGEFDRLVVFRLGKMIGVKGPGRFVVFPWMDRIKRIDVRAAAFAVPPQQFITIDGGIVEMGAEIQYGIVDVVTMIREVVNHQDILRSLGKTLLIKILVKKEVSELEKDKRTPESEILDAINDQVCKWGINVHRVKLSEAKVLKQPESGSNPAVSSVLKGLGMKNDPKYPTPQEFVRATHGLEKQPTDSMLGSFSVTGTSAEVNMNLLQNLNGGSGGGGSSQVQPGGMGMVDMAIQNPPDKFSANWKRCLEVILANDFGPSVTLEQEAHGLYQLEITETEAGRDIYFLDLSATNRTISKEEPLGGREPDVSIVISSPDLASILEGSLAPLQAYLTGRISATGDIRKLMFFDKLSKRGHKPGSTFTV